VRRDGRPTPQLLQAFGVQTLEELREAMGITKPAGTPDPWVEDQRHGDAGVVAGDPVGCSNLVPPSQSDAGS
jgi:hypothetical protein